MVKKAKDLEEMVERRKGVNRSNVKNERSMTKNIFKVIFLLVFVAAIAGCVWAYLNYRDAQKEVVRLSELEAEESASVKETTEILDAVKKLILLPSGEDPSIATVTDVAALKKDQPFYQDASNGDKVLIYAKARKVIIYSPEKGIIINVGPIFVDKSVEKNDEDKSDADNVEKDSTNDAEKKTEDDKEKSN